MVAARAVTASVAAVEMVRAKPTGAACIALAEVGTLIVREHIAAGLENPTKNFHRNSIDGGGALSKFRFMLKSHINSNRNGIVFPPFLASGFWPVLLLVLGLLVGPWLSVSATENDDRYFRIYGLIEQGDNLSKGGQTERAKAKYVEAEKALKELKQLYPTYNPKLVTARLTYLADKIAVLAKPPVVAMEANVISEPAAAVKAIVPGQPQVKLLEAGAEPRKVFRLQAKPMDTQKSKMTAKISMGISAPEMPGQTMKMPAINMSATVTTKSVTAEGDVNYELVIEEVGVASDSDMPPEVAEGMKSSLAAMKGLVIAGTVTDRYYTKKIEAKIPPGTDAQTREGMEQMKDSFANTEFMLPEEAIGVGAKWEIKEKAKKQGMTIDQVTRHELVSVAGDSFATKSSTTQSAANQKIPNPIMPTLKADMTKMTGSATGTSTADLTKILPSQATSDEQVEINMAINAGGKKQVMTMKTETRATLESD